MSFNIRFTNIVTEKNQMSVPLLLLGAGTMALLARAKYTDAQRCDESIHRLPDQTNNAVDPINGAVVFCGVYGVFEHTGIWVNGNILELKGNGLIRCVSPSRFLQQRSGDYIYIACDDKHNPLIQLGAADRAISQLFSYSEYDVISNNCHKFVWHCISAENIPLTRFSKLNQKIAEHFATEIHWHPLN